MNICEEHSLYCSVIEFRTAYFYEMYEQSVHTLTTVELASGKYNGVICVHWRCGLLWNWKYSTQNLWETFTCRSMKRMTDCIIAAVISCLPVFLLALLINKLPNPGSSGDLLAHRLPAQIFDCSIEILTSWDASRSVAWGLRKQARHVGWSVRSCNMSIFTHW